MRNFYGFAFIPVLALSSMLVWSNWSTPADSEPSPSSVDKAVHFDDGDILSGLVEGEMLYIPEGNTVFASADLTLKSTGWLRIDGRLVAQDVSTLDSDSPNAPSITLISDSRITIRGIVQGGRGLSFEGIPLEECMGLAGGDGSGVTISAPDVLLAATGAVFGGDGGQGGSGAVGGDGGSITVAGAILSDHGLTDSERLAVAQGIGYVSGNGGSGGHGHYPLIDGGNGGDSGGIYREIDEAVSPSKNGQAESPAQGPLLFNTTSCSNGVPGTTPAPSTGGVGGPGAPGDNGTAGNHDGGNGGKGGDARAITGGTAGDAGDGGNCCGEPSGQGGAGGLAASGGSASAGDGGTGGKGGDCYAGSQGSGGNGGAGGSGGDATGGKGGRGGNGGDGVPPGSGASGGASGVGMGGNAGAGGAPGTGTPSGNPGPLGTGGSSIAGGTGNSGSGGDLCPQGGG